MQDVVSRGDTVKMISLEMENIFITEDVPNADMTKVQQLEQCLRNLNFQY